MTTTDDIERAVEDTSAEPARPARRQLVGTVMIIVAVIGLVVSTVGTVVAWQLIGRLNDSSRDSLAVTIDTLDTVDDSIVLAGDVLDATTETLGTAGATLDAVAASFDEATGVVSEIDELTETVGPALGAASGTLRDLESVGDTIDALLEELDGLPFVPNYDPATGLGTAIGQLADEIEPLPASFADTSVGLDAFEISIDELRAEVTRLAGDVEGVTAELSATDQLVEQYRTNISDARAVAVSTMEGLDDDVALMRIVLVIAGINFAVAQIVPFWLGRRLRSATVTPSVTLGV